MPHCRSCAGFVSRRFARVFGNNDDEVYGCQGCLSTSEIVGSSIATPTEVE